MNFPADPAAVTTSVVAPVAAPVSTAGSIAQMGFSLVLVIGAIFALAWLLRWLQGARSSGSGALRLHAGLQVGAKERILLIQAGDTHLLIGVAPGRVQKLHVFDEAPLLPEVSSGAVPSLPPFAEKLRELLQRSGKGA